MENWKNLNNALSDSHKWYKTIHESIRIVYYMLLGRHPITLNLTIYHTTCPIWANDFQEINQIVAKPNFWTMQIKFICSKWIQSNLKLTWQNMDNKHQHLLTSFVPNCFGESQHIWMKLSKSLLEENHQCCNIQCEVEDGAYFGNIEKAISLYWTTIRLLMLVLLGT